MEIVRELKFIPNLSLALGFFDGLHLGHQAVIGNAVSYARQNGTKSAVVTFSNHPFCYLRGVKAPKYILTNSDKYKMLEKLGVDYVVELEFDEIKSLTAQDYVENVLVKYFSPKFITSGLHHHFGSCRSGNSELLTKLQSKYDYEYKPVHEILQNGVKISSTSIRNFIENGEIEFAENMLGRKFSIIGDVQHGKQKGRTIGFPTANIFYPDGIIQPPHGVYDVNVLINDKKYRGISNFGTCPTVTMGEVTTFETHLLYFDADLYGKEIRVEFNKKIRDEKKFSSIEELKHQIQLDIDGLI